MTSNTRRPGPKSAWLGLAATLAGLFPSSIAWAGPSASAALGKLSRGDAAGAKAEYEQLLAKSPSDARLAFNAGAAAHQAGDWESAARHHESALASPDLALQQRAFFGLGSARFRQGEAAKEPGEKARLWEESARHYQAAVGLNAADTDARANLEAVREQLARLQREQKQQEKNQPDQGGQKKGDPNDAKKDSREGKQDGQGGSSKDPSKGSKQDGQGSKDPGPKPGQNPGQGQGNPTPDDEAQKGSKDNPGGRMQPRKDGDSGPEPQSKGPDGKDGNAAPRAAEQPRANAPGARGGTSGSTQEGGAQASGAQDEDPGDGRMALRFAERLLDSHKREERALIWSAPRTAQSESRSAGRKTW